MCIRDRIDPVRIIFKELKYAEVGEAVVEFEDVQNGAFVFELSLSEGPSFGLLSERSEVESRAEVEVLARALNIRMLHDAGRSVVEPQSITPRFLA